MTEIAVVVTGLIVLAIVAYWSLVGLTYLGLRHLKTRIAETSGQIGVAQCDTIAFEQLEAHAKRLADELRVTRGAVNV